MLISQLMNQRLNEQITNELGASHAYMGMASAFDKMGLKLLSKRFEQQSDEERGHAMKILKYIQDIGGTVMLDAIPKPQPVNPVPRAVVEAALQSELTVTRQIYDLVSLAEQERDYATRSFLQWFVDEQVEEVDQMSELLQLMTIAGEANLLTVESRLAALMEQQG